MPNSSIYFKAENAGGRHDIKEIKRTLDEIPGVSSVSVNADSGRIAVDYDSTGTSREEIHSRLSSLGIRLLQED